VEEFGEGREQGRVGAKATYLLTCFLKEINHFIIELNLLNCLMTLLSGVL